MGQTPMDERRPGRTRAEGPALVEGLAAWVAGQAGWRRRALTTGFGALAAIALPPLNALPFLVPAFVGLLWLLDGVGPPAPEMAMH
jgi:apolipoprotein N-acyltransferase